MTVNWFDSIYLESDQKELLAWMVEAERSVPKDRRAPFLLLGMLDGWYLIYPGHEDRPGVHQADLDTLAERGLVRPGLSGDGTRQYAITPEGRRYYAEMMSHAGGATEVLEEEVRRYLNTEAFQSAFPEAYRRWRGAEEKLWSAEDTGALTEIGHACREAMQHFANGLLIRTDIPDPAAGDSAKIILRVRAVLDSSGAQGARGEFLNALLTYWGTVSDLSQRAEHGAQKEGEPISWEDVRMLVFHTGIVMFEVARATVRPRP